MTCLLLWWSHRPLLCLCWTFGVRMRVIQAKPAPCLLLKVNKTSSIGYHLLQTNGDRPLPWQSFYPQLIKEFLLALSLSVSLSLCVSLSLSVSLSLCLFLSLLLSLPLSSSPSVLILCYHLLPPCCLVWPLSQCYCLYGPQSSTLHMILSRQWTPGQSFGPIAPRTRLFYQLMPGEALL